MATIADMSVKTAQIALLTCIAWASACCAAEPGYSPVHRRFVHSERQGPWDLPRRFRNHCSFDVTYAIYYCSDHCGVDYQIYYCSKRSFGCCHIGHGYCDWNALLRCRP